MPNMFEQREGHFNESNARATENPRGDGVEGIKKPPQESISMTRHQTSPIMTLQYSERGSAELTAGFAEI